MRLGGVDRVRRAVRDVAADDDQRRALLLGLRRAGRPLERAQVLGVRDRLHVPAVRLEALALVLGREAERRRAVDRDVVVVVVVDELAEAEVAGDRRGLHRDPLHHVAVGADRVDAAVDDLVVGPVVALGEEAVGDREADAVREALPERAGRRLDPLGDEVLRMAGRLRAPLAEALELLEREVVAGEMERGVLEDAGVAGREDEAVAVRPVRVGRVVPHHPPVEQVGERRKRHRGAGMAGVRLLHAVHRERADRVDRKLLDLRVCAHGSNDKPLTLSGTLDDALALPLAHGSPDRIEPPQGALRRPALRQRLLQGRARRPAGARRPERGRQDDVASRPDRRDGAGGWRAGLGEGRPRGAARPAAAARRRLLPARVRALRRSRSRRGRARATPPRAGHGLRRPHTGDAAALRRDPGSPRARGRLRLARPCDRRPSRPRLRRRRPRSRPRHLLRRGADARFARARARGESRPAAARRADQPPRHGVDRVARAGALDDRRCGHPGRP